MNPSLNRVILHVLAPAREGGLESVVTMLSAGQGRSRAHVAAVITPDMSRLKYPFLESLQAVGVPVTRVIVGARSYWAEFKSLASLVVRLKPVVVHTHGYRADIIGGLVARSCGVPTVSTVHGFTGGGARNRMNERIQCFALRRSDGVIAVSRPLARTLAAAGVPLRKIHCVQNGFTPPSRVLSRAEARRELGIADDRLVAGWVGRLSEEKGADLMLQALAECEAEWHLSVIGDGRESTDLHQQTAALGLVDRVQWHGAIPNAGALLSAFDALVLSSRTEGTPIVLFEAMHAGIPIIATRVGGVPDVVSSAHAILVPPEQPRAIAVALAELRREPSAATQRVRRAGQRLIRSFDQAAWLAEVDAVYKQVCA